MKSAASLTTPTFAARWLKAAAVSNRLSKLRRAPGRALCGLLILSLLSVPTIHAGVPALSLERLMQQFAGIEHRQTRFSETRQLALLESNLTAEGSLSFEAPDRLSKTYDPPDGQSYEISGNRLTLRKADGREEIVLLDNSPQLLAYVASLRAVLAGDLQRLRTYFDTRLSGSAADWRLTLSPRDPRLARQILRIEITGRQAEIVQSVVIEQGGDRIVTRLHGEHDK